MRFQHFPTSNNFLSESDTKDSDNFRRIPIGSDNFSDSIRWDPTVGLLVLASSSISLMKSDRPEKNALRSIQIYFSFAHLSIFQKPNSQIQNLVSCSSKLLSYLQWRHQNGFICFQTISKSSLYYIHPNERKIRCISMHSNRILVSKL